MDIIGMILNQIDWIQLILYAAVVAVWEGLKLGIKKLAQVKPQVYIKFLIPILGIVFLFASDTIASRLNAESWYILLAGIGLVSVSILLYLWRWRHVILRWKEKRG